MRRVPGPAHRFRVRGIQRQRAGGGHPEGVHEFLRQKFAHAGAQHGPAIGAAAIGRGATAFELHLPAPAVEHAFKHGDGPPIAIAVAGAERALLDVFRAVDREGIAGGPAERPHRRLRHRDVAGEQTLELRIVRQALAQPQLLEQSAAMCHILRRRQRRWCHRHVMAREHLARPVIVAINAGLRIRLQRLQQRVVGLLRKGRKAGGRHCALTLLAPSWRPRRLRWEPGHDRWRAVRAENRSDRRGKDGTA